MIVKKNQPKLNKRISCRSCGSKKLLPILSLGNLAISNFVDTEKEQVKAPLELVLCDPHQGGCSLLQLAHTAVDPDEMYRTYWYRSGMNQSMRDALKDIAKKVEGLIKFDKNDIVLDIGSNDSTLLRAFSSKKIRRVGFEPAKNLMRDARPGTDLIINEYFNSLDFEKYFGKKKARVITTIAMFYDLEDPNIFVRDVKKTLSHNGVWVNQMSYLPLMLEENAFDNICHEHIEYYSLTSLQSLLKRHNLEIFDVELNEVNGGSFRTYIRHKNENISAFSGGEKRAQALLLKEKHQGIDTPTPYESFERRVQKIKKELVSFIKKEVKNGKSFYVYGASTKGNTLLQYMRLDDKLIKAAAERNPEKWGKKTVATNIPIVSEEDARRAHPDYFLVLPWHFKDEFIKRERNYLKDGGKMLFPLPHSLIVDVNGKVVDELK